MGNRNAKYFVIQNQIKELSSLAEDIDQLAADWKLSPKLAMNVNLVLEEALSNIVFYAFPDKKKHEIKISILLKNSIISIEITDDGIPFNPLSQDAPNIALPAEERPVGGLGIFLISKIMDQIHYTRKNKQNILTLNKRI